MNFLQLYNFNCVGVAYVNPISAVEYSNFKVLRMGLLGSWLKFTDPNN